jgi:hypothetical protein
MGRKLGRRLAAFVIAVSGVAGLAVSTQPAAGGPSNYVYFKYNVNATTHLKTLDQTITLKGGTFNGYIDFTTAGAESVLPLKGSIVLPQASFTYRAAGIVPLITATAKIVPTKPVTGTLDLLNGLMVTATATFNIRIISAYAQGTTTNLVGDTCKTATPVSVTMSGPGSLGTDPSVFSGEYTLPKLAGCGLVQTAALNLVLPGPGNTFTATATPKSPIVGG